MLFPEAKDKKKKEQILSSRVFGTALAQLEEDRQRCLSTPIEPVSFFDYNRYFVTGSRREYEDCYFARRGRLTALTLSALLYDRDEDIRALENTIWAICDEFTWILPAHITDLGDRFDPGFIDLFAAETGFALSEIHYLLSDRLHPKVNRRIMDCLEERIFSVFLNHSCWWEEAKMNWAAVCAGSVGAAFLYAAPERFPLVHTRILSAMDHFLSGFGEDGACLEGIGYWNYGFGFFTYFAQLLYEFSGGAENLFSHPKCKQIASFQQKAFLRKNYTISFSDGNQTNGFLPGLTHKLHQIYGSDITLLPMQYAEFDEYCHRFPAYLRNFFWADPDASCSNQPAGEEIYFPDAGWYIRRQKDLTLASKAGHNDEPHNHNDVGSFFLVSDQGQVLCDFGCGEYSRDYFRPETRYTFLCNSSLGHNLPIINGQAQQAGASYKGEILSHGEDSVCMEIGAAYGSCGLTSLQRSLRFTEEGFFLTDQFSFTSEKKQVVERFVTMQEPKWDGSRLMIGDFELFSSNAGTPTISQEVIQDHSAQYVTLYLIDYNLTNPTEFRLTLR